jgi:cellulose synthase/poly-beta-1,6-N-acetylglucosamine synthase-like glycosyltransferase
MSSLSLVFLTRAHQLVFFAYTAVVVTHFLVQVSYAHRYHRRGIRDAAEHEGEELPPFLPTVDVIVPCFNEDPEPLDRCLLSLLEQDYEGGLRVFVIDDGSSQREQLLPVYQRYENLPGWTLILSQRNAGKRHAQDVAFRAGEGELVVTIDSDTEIASDGIGVIVNRFRDPKVGAAVANLTLANRSANLLTRVVAVRYWFAFNQERAAQAFFRSVLCCSGPFSVYRRSALLHVWSRYTSQTFRGVACTYGDDRHLTNLMLGEGHDAVFEPRAVARTNTPTRLREYLRQQLRWSRSFYRELLWTFPYLSRRPWYVTFEVYVNILLPPMLAFAVGSSLLFAILIDPRYLLHSVLAIALMATARSAYGLFRLRDPRFLLFVVYGFLSTAFLIPVRIRAISTLTDNRWGTRVKKAVIEGT